MTAAVIAALLPGLPGISCLCVSAATMPGVRRGRGQRKRIAKDFDDIVRRDHHADLCLHLSVPPAPPPPPSPPLTDCGFPQQASSNTTTIAVFSNPMTFDIVLHSRNNCVPRSACLAHARPANVSSYNYYADYLQGVRDSKCSCYVGNDITAPNFRQVRDRV